MSQSSRRTADGGLQRSGSKRRPLLFGRITNDSSSTLVGSALERKMNDVDSGREVYDTTERLEELRKLMQKESLDYYIVPTSDPHGSEYVSASDKRREWLTGFNGSAGQAVVSKTAAYLITDSRYWLQAEQQLDENWVLIKAGEPPDGPKDWVEWLVDRVNGSRIGIDARMLTHEQAVSLNSQLNSRNSKLVYPLQNLIDLLWLNRPPRSREPVYIQPMEFTGRNSAEKLDAVRKWIEEQPAAVPSYAKGPPTQAQKHIGTVISNLASIAYLLNLRGADVPFNPVFLAYLYIGLEKAVIFIDKSKLDASIGEYLDSLGIEVREYNDIWTFLRKREMGEGKVLINNQTSYAIALMLTHLRYTVAPAFVEEMKAVKNEVEIEGLRHAYMRDGAAYVRWLAWLEEKINQGYEITEYEAAFRLTEYRRHNKHFMGLAYENISASGPNAALPHYTPSKNSAAVIDRDTPYLNDSGGQYRDGTCDTTRTVHFGRPTPEQCEAFTRVLQGHIAIDSAIFPEGTTGMQLDVLARKALWQDGMNYMHGTGHGVGSFLNVHEGPQSFSAAVPLVPGHALTNEPGFYEAGKWGVRIESALVVRRVKTKREFNGDIWLGFERLTAVPIQTKMVKDGMLSKEEKAWLKEHNRRCLEKLEPYIREDKRALKWLRREAERGIGQAAAVAGGLAIDWD
jgi:Xaa-Pro aminopeptidase